MCGCLHVFVCVPAKVCVCVCLHMWFLSAYVCVSIYLLVYAYVYLCLHMCVCMCVCLHVYVWELKQMKSATGTMKSLNPNPLICKLEHVKERDLAFSGSCLNYRFTKTGFKTVLPMGQVSPKTLKTCWTHNSVNQLMMINWQRWSWWLNDNLLIIKLWWGSTNNYQLIMMIVMMKL